ncbi:MULTISPECIES: class II aldolase/adducin family protein [unclassified Ruegeria]|uniref:class II aldolase/adducin family protein n=1 Tax=unclassified Ruegeria TaxID=2625375 RepID=UPI001491A87F
MENLELRTALIATCRAMNASGINQGTSGNVSVRAGDGFLITPSGMPYDTMTPEDIVDMAFDGSYQGPRPSSEWRFHRDILEARTDANAVVHCHSVHATALACHHRSIPSFHYMTAVAGGTDIKCAGYATFGTQELSDKALTALEGRRACLLGQHGQIAIGKSLSAALWLATEVETLSQIYINALALGEPPVLSDKEMAAVIEKMNSQSYWQSSD